MASDTATLYIKDIFKHHRAPRQTIMDRGLQFAFKYLHMIYQHLGIKPTMSTAFHPQIDGQTEQWNAKIEQCLRAFINYRQTDRARHLQIAEFASKNQPPAQQDTPHFTSYMAITHSYIYIVTPTH